MAVVEYENNMETLIDPTLLSESIFEVEILRCIYVGLSCVQEFAKDRPTMSTTLSMLTSEIATLPTPKQPACTKKLVSSDSNSCQKAIKTDTISVGQSLTGNQTIISKYGSYELGFFTPGKSLNSYIGIWYKKVTIQTVVWVANRDKPLSDPSSAELKLLDNGNLVLYNQYKIPIWSTNSISNTLNSSEAVLDDDGNFFLRDVSNPSVVLWQSIENPTDTFLPGGKVGFNKRTNKAQLLTSWRNEEDPAPGIFSVQLDPNGTSQYLINWNGYQTYWISGEWNGHTFNFIPKMRVNHIFNFSYIRNDEESYFTCSVYNNTVVSRLVLDLSGQIKLYTWSERSQQWNLFWSQPKLCDVYGICGPFGSCNQDTLKCDCLPGFEKRFPKDWDLSDSTGGCVRKTPLQCGRKDVFSPMSNMIIPANPQASATTSAEECEAACANKCSCNAYAYGRSSGCSLWDGDLLNVKQQSNGGGDLYLRLADPAIQTSTDQNSKDIGTSEGKRTPIWKFIIIIPIITLGTSTLCVLGYMFLRRKKANQRGALERLHGVRADLVKTKDSLKDSTNAKISKDGVNEGETPELQLFDLVSITIATNNFCLTNKLGEGGFGPVYKGKLQNGQDIAVKRLCKSSGQGIEEFKNEVVLISKLQHRNLVRLLGYCTEAEENMLLYEYMPNKSLDAFLFDPRKRAQLDWKKRFNIIEGIARGLLYLHRDSRLRIIHRDLKVSNILLDEDMNPKISDFGMARIFGGQQTIANTNRVVGTFGYMSPEYIMGGTFSEKSDVFSFGVLILEIVSSRRNNSFYNPEQPLNLLLHTWRLWNEGKWSELIDEALADSYSPLEVMRCIHVGLLCVQERAVDRPTMSTVDLMLSSETDRPSPKEPPFTSITPFKSELLQIGCTNNNVTVSMIEGR